MMELLSPAGSTEAVRAAVNAGAGAIYLGYGDFNARRRAKNFTEEDLRWAVEYCRVRGVRVFLTENTLVRSRELERALAIGALANELGIDAVLVQDLGLARALKSRYPDLPLHASTQMTVHSLDGVQLCADAGMERVVLSRELSRDAIAHICAHSPVEIETFVHGALCMCYSGQCFLSSILGGRSGNRGLCAQPCRLPYACDGGKISHPLSLKDASLAGYLKDLEDMGVACVKIEGRMKRPEYVSIVTGIYARALAERREPTDRELADLAAAFSRDGFTQGYFLDEKGPAMFGTRSESENTDALFAAARESYRKDAQLVPVEMSFRAECGQPISASVTDLDGNTVTSSGCVPEAARNRSTTAEEIASQLSRSGGTPFAVRKTEISVPDGLSIPKSELNALRRELLEQLTALRAAVPPRRVNPGAIAPLFASSSTPSEMPAAAGDEPQLIFTLRRADQLTEELAALPHRRIDLPLEELCANPASVSQALEQGAHLCAQLPRIGWDREKPALLENLKTVAALGVHDALIPSWDMLYPARSLGFTLHGDFALGVCNDQTLLALHELGFSDATLSFELKTPQLRDLAKAFPAEAIVYGRLPLMALEQFPGGKPVQTLTDRLGVRFPVLPMPGDRAELLNSQLLYLADKPEWRSLGLRSLRLLFTTESPAECLAVAEQYAGLASPQPPKNYTRGLYYRDVE